MTVDFHYKTVEEAVWIVEQIISEVRLNDERRLCSFITGHGKIKKALLELLKEQYNLDPQVPMFNSGMIDVYIE